MKYGLLGILLCISLIARTQFIRVVNHQFYCNGKPYTYVGANYWYGAYLAADTIHQGQLRLAHELDMLKKNGITNIRVMLSGEGDSTYPYRIAPALQTSPGEFNTFILKSCDYFIQACKQRNIKIVFVLNNQWEWSGGMGQYLEWNGYGKAPLPKTPEWDWDAYCKYTAQFYSCTQCQLQYFNLINTLLNRVNTLNGIVYKDEPTIMAWQLANEPRPMLKEAIPLYTDWITATASYIKSIDTNHLVSTGVEGVIGTAQDSGLFEQIHMLHDVDYATMHIWPKTWGWYNGESAHSVTDTTLQKTYNYIQQHIRIMNRVNKPLVIEEFGLHRDGNTFSPKAAVKNRNKYYTYILQQLIDAQHDNTALVGCNFWGYCTLPENVTDNKFWQKGMGYSADPPQEEQGLYGVFDSDKTTWRIIKQYSRRLR